MCLSAPGDSETNGGRLNWEIADVADCADGERLWQTVRHLANGYSSSDLILAITGVSPILAGRKLCSLGNVVRTDANAAPWTL